MHLVRLLAFAFAVSAPAAAGTPAPLGPPAPAPHHLSPRQDRNSGNTRTNMVQYWENDFANLDWESGPGGEFSVTWNQGVGGNFVVGKGYRPGGEMLFNYTGSFQVRNRAYLALYGWTTNPLVEWYVIESMGVHNPSDNRNATCHGRIESDGGTYEVWSKWRVNEPSIIGDATYQQYWSIRTEQRCGGQINTANHLAAFRRAGLELGRHNFMALAIEGQQGSGSATLTAGGPPPTTPITERPTPTARSEIPRNRAACTTSLH